MRRIMGTNGKSIYEIFDSFSDFLNTCDSRERKGGSFGNVRTNHGDDEWAGASYDVARDLLVHGYDKSIKSVSSQVNKLQRQSFVEKPRRVRDYVGFAPIVPNVVLGYPKTMWNSKMETKRNKVITLLYDVGVNAGVSKSQLEEHGAKVVNYIMNLERLGYRIRIDAMDGYYDHYDTTYCFRVAVKHEDQPINLKRIAFPMTHVAFLRTLSFDWYERCPDAKYIGGYGTSLYTMDKHDRDEALAPILGENEYYINYKLDPEEVFSDFAEELKGAR